MDNHRPIDAVLNLLRGVSRTGDKGCSWKAHCPAHPDEKKSLSIGVTGEGKVLLRCFAGCTFPVICSALGMKQHELFPMTENDERFVMPSGECGDNPDSPVSPDSPDSPDSPAAQPDKPPSITVADLAAAKGLPVSFLTGSGIWLRDIPSGGVGIPYYGETAATQLLVRPRTALKAVDGSFWQRGKKMVPYGLWRLKEAREKGWLVGVEGESDSWTLWFHGFPCLGIPGANNTKCLQKAHLDGISKLYVFREPVTPGKPAGTGGDAFVNGIGWLLKKWAWGGQALVVSIPGLKDPNDLHRRDPERFKEEFQRCLDAAVPMPEPMAPGKLAKRQALPPAEETVAAAKKAAEASPPAEAGFFALTHWGNAKRLVHRHGQSILYNHAWCKWMIWDGMRFKVDTTAKIDRLAKDTVTTIYAEAADPSLSPQRRDEIQKWAEQSESDVEIAHMKHSAQSELEVSVLPEDLDNNEWLLNVLNSTIDLRTGEISPHDRKNKITKLATVTYDPAATCPIWEAFLHKILAGRQDVIDFFQRAVGYSMTASTWEKCFFFLYGSGDNGKSTALETIAAMLGNYWMKTPAETILSRPKSGSDAIPNDVARLVKVRMVSAAEVEEDRQLNESRIKDMTGGDQLSARFMRSEWFEFFPVFKLWMYGNHRPIIVGTDEAIWARIRLIPFTVSIPKAEQDHKLREKLRAELSGILNWAIRGCLEWQRHKLGTPVDVAAAGDEYRGDMDTLARFIDECCFTGDERYECQSSQLYSRYTGWCKINGEYPKTQTKFSLMLKTKGYKKDLKRSEGNTIFWKRISMKPLEADGDHNGNGRASGGSGLDRFDV